MLYIWLYFTQWSTGPTLAQFGCLCLEWFTMEFYYGYYKSLFLLPDLNTKVAIGAFSLFNWHKCTRIKLLSLWNALGPCLGDTTKWSYVISSYRKTPLNSAKSPRFSIWLSFSNSFKQKNKRYLNAILF